MLQPVPAAHKESSRVVFGCITYVYVRLPSPIAFTMHSQTPAAAHFQRLQPPLCPSVYSSNCDLGADFANPFRACYTSLRLNFT